jgi:acetamidase/formamidase
MRIAAIAVSVLLLSACGRHDGEAGEVGGTVQSVPANRFTIPQGNEHYAFSRAIAPVLRVPDGSVVEVHAKEASDNLVTPGMTSEEYRELVWPEPYGHPLSGPVHVEGAAPGDTLSVTLLEIEVGDWGWTDTHPDYAFVGKELDEIHVKTYAFTEDKKYAKFADGILVPLRPFPGVMGVAPDTDEMLSTVPPRANGGNMDDPDIVEGTTVHFPVFVEGALFSIGDPHAAQGHGEVSGTAIEAPARVVYRVDVVKGGRRIAEPQYETDDFYAVTAFAPTLDEAAKNATRYMIAYLVEVHGMERHQANMLSSIAADLKIGQVVNGSVLVSMHISKAIIEQLVRANDVSADSLADD